MAYNRGFQQQGGPSPWASGIVPYGPSQQPMFQPQPNVHGSGNFGGVHGQQFPVGFGGGGVGGGGHFQAAGGMGFAQQHHAPVYGTPGGRMSNMNRGPVQRNMAHPGPLVKRPAPGYVSEPVAKRPNRPVNLPNNQVVNARNRNIHPNNNNQIRKNITNQSINNNKQTTNVASKPNVRNQTPGKPIQGKPVQGKPQNQKPANNNAVKDDGEVTMNTVIVPFNGFHCKLCNSYLENKAARTKHVELESHKTKFEAEVAKAAAKKKATPIPSKNTTSTPITKAVTPSNTPAKKVLTPAANKTPAQPTPKAKQTPASTPTTSGQVVVEAAAAEPSTGTESCEKIEANGDAAEPQAGIVAPVVEEQVNGISETNEVAPEEGNVSQVSDSQEEVAAETPEETPSSSPTKGRGPRGRAGGPRGRGRGGRGARGRGGRTRGAA